jgi:hypothetical protein
MLLLVITCTACNKYEESLDAVERIQVSPYSTSGDGTRMSENPDLFAFVGTKISISEVEQTSLDAAFDCKYKILQWVYNHLPEDTIEFRAYDHFGRFPFANYDHVLMFISRYDDTLYHEKYQFFPVYQTSNGRWAGCGDPYLMDGRTGQGIQAHELSFDSPPSFNFKVLSDKYTPDYVEFVFTEPWFICTPDSAICKMGAYVEDLFRLKRDGVLQNRGLFYAVNDSARQSN